MNRTLTFVSIAVFSVFLGSQITEGFLLVPFWKTLSSTEFYAYYAEFGPLIGRFYTCLTIIAVLIPFGLSFYCYYYKPHALKYAIVSTLFAVLVIAVFYGYFKDTNQQFFEAVFDTHQLQSVLDDWEYWHWLRVLFELISLIFLLLTFLSIDRKNSKKTIEHLKHNI